MSGADAERVHQRNRVLGHVAELVGRRDRNFQEAQFQQFQRAQPLAAGEFGGLADVAVVETDDAEAARGELTITSLAEESRPPASTGGGDHPH